MKTAALAALAAALLAAAVLPGEPLGLGVPLVAALVAAAAGPAAPRRVDAATFGSLALLLASVPALRDADWVVALSLAGAWALACLAVGGARPTAVLSPVVRLRDLPSLSPPLPARLAPATRGAVLAALLLAVFGSLFAAADAAFAQLVEDVPRPAADTVPGRATAFVVVLLAACSLALAARRPVRPRQVSTTRRLSPLEWGVALGTLDALFLAFVVVQLAFLFGGHDRILETAGLTYAEYARQGFWQLLTASALTLAVVGALGALADRPRRRDRVLLGALLGLLCVLTLVVLASCLRRLELYEDAYGLTRARLGAEAVALWLGGVFALVLAAGLVRAVRARLASLAAAGTGLFLLAFALSDPDRLVAERNVAHWRETGRIDLAYARSLSADAVPALATLPGPLRDGALDPIRHRLADRDGWSSLNLARERARALLEAAD